MFWKHSCFLRAINAAIFILLLGSGVTFAQKVPPPEEILGFKIGTDLHLATYQQAVEYFRMLEKASLKIKLFEIGKTSIGKPMIYAIITSAENMPIAIAKYPAESLLMSGYLKGEKYLQNKISALEVLLGKGKIIMLGFGVQSRGQSYGTLKMLFNSLYYGSVR